MIGFLRRTAKFGLKEVRKFFARPEQDLITLGDLIDRLSICNCKLYEVCAKKKEAGEFPHRFSKTDIEQLLAKDISLCKERSQLKNEINKLFGKFVEEVKLY